MRTPPSLPRLRPPSKTSIFLPPPVPKGHPKLESALWQLVEAQRQRGSAGLAEEAQRGGIELRDSAVRVIVEAKPGQAQAAAARAESLGGEVEGSYEDLVQVLAPVAMLERLADADSIRFVRQPWEAIPAAVTGQGVGLINADDWHAAGMTGSGVKVAILDLGFAGYTTLLGSELPASVTARSFYGDPTGAAGDITGGGENHGTAVAEIVHEVAPGAQMYLVNSQTDVEFLSAVDWLIGQDVDVVNFSAGWAVIGPGDGTGYINDKVSQAVSSGIVWSNAAGNSANKHWMGNWTSSDGDWWNDFSQSPFDETNTFAASAGNPIDIQLKWDDPFGASGNDYDLCLLNSSLAIIVCSENRQDGDDYPVERIVRTAPYTGTYHIGIWRYSATRGPLFHLYVYPSTPQYVVAGRSLSIPADNSHAITVGAVPWNNPDSIESFSSQGPTEDGRVKPDLVAPDGVSTATYGTFYGTSAAAPHVAGAAALVKQAFPCFSPAEIKSSLEANVVDLGPGGKDNIYGAGRLSLGSPPSPCDTGFRCNPSPVANPPKGDFDADGRTDYAVWRPSDGAWYIRGAPSMQWGLPGDIPVLGDYDGDPQCDLAVWRPSDGTWHIRGMATVAWGLPEDIPIPADYDGDGKTDLAVWRPSNGTWHIRSIATVKWGLPEDIPIPADYDGDGKTDLAVWRPSNGTWYIRGIATVKWGLPADIPVPADYDGDGKTDLAVWRPSNGTWYIRGIATVTWGLPADIPAPADYDGDTKADLAVWRPPNGTWYIRGIATVTWGLPADIPIPGFSIEAVRGDYNGDGRADYAVWRPSTGTWYIRGIATVTWGLPTDIPAPADYDGDGKTDIAVWRPSNGTWYIRGIATVTWGLPTDIPVPADYDGDGKTDIAVWRPSNGTWYIRGIATVTWGLPADIPVPADYDGDGKTDIAVWRPSNGTWYIRGIATVTWGLPADIPVPADYDGDGKTDIAVWRPSNGTWYIRGIATVTWGLPADIPVPADYDGDRRTDIAVWRPSNGTWYIRDIATVTWGLPADIPVVGD